MRFTGRSHGNDTLFGGSGRDNIAGGLGADRLNGVDRDDSFTQTTGGPDTLFGAQRPAGRSFVERPAEVPAFLLSSVVPSSADSSDDIDDAFADPLLPKLLEL